MRTATPFVPTPEAAFIANLSDRDMNRIVDEHLVPDVLVSVDGGRLFSRLAAAFASFYFATEEQFVAALRRRIMGELTQRIEQRNDRSFVFALDQLPRDLDWSITVPSARIDLSAYILDASARTRQVERANSLIHVDPEIMGGIPVFVGTRVPVDTITASLDVGVDMEELRESYPFVTDEHVEAARTYLRIHPRRGRPRRLSEVHPTWKVRKSYVVSPGTAK